MPATSTRSAGPIDSDRPVPAADSRQQRRPPWSSRSPGIAEKTYWDLVSPAGGETVGGAMQLTEQMAENGVRPIWLGYVGVDDVDATVARIDAAGGQVQMPPSDIPQAGRIAMVADPQGAPFYVMRPTPPAWVASVLSVAVAVMVSLSLTCSRPGRWRHRRFR